MQNDLPLSGEQESAASETPVMEAPEQRPEKTEPVLPEIPENVWPEVVPPFEAKLPETSVIELNKKINLQRVTEELADAGLADIPFSRTDNGTLEFSESVTSDQRKKIKAVFAQHDASKPSRSEIRALLTAIDEKKIRAITDSLLKGDNTRLSALEAEAAALRAQL